MSDRLGGDWANPLRGHATAAPPSNVMNWRRLTSGMGSPPEPAVPAYRRFRMPRKRPRVLGVDLNCSEIAAWGGPGVGSHRRTDEQFQLVICQMMRRAPSGGTAA